jgi:hypothetical protein
MVGTLGWSRKMTAEQKDSLVEVLRQVASRPAMYFGNCHPESADIWLAGFRIAILLLEIRKLENRQLYEKALKERGWKVTATSSWRQMLEKGMTSAEIIEELIAIEIEFVTALSMSS